MPRPTVSLFTITALLLAVAITLAATARPAPAIAAPSPALTIAVVDLDRILAGLEEGAAVNASLAAKRAELKAALNAIEMGIKDHQKRLENAAPDDRLAIEADLYRLVERGKAEANASNLIMHAYEDKARADLGAKIQDAITAVAEAEGVMIVFNSDAPPLAAPGPTAATEPADNAKLTSRRVFYASNEADLTQQVIDYMNNRFAAGQ